MSVSPDVPAVPPIPPDVRRLAIVGPSWVGDTVMATPVFRAARQVLPRARLVAMVRRGLNDVLAGNPWLDEVIVCDMKGALGVLRLASAIRTCRADAVLLLPNSFRSALAARLSGAPIRAGYDRDARGWLLTHRHRARKTNSPVAMVEYYADLARWALRVDHVDPTLELAATNDDRAAAQIILADVAPPFIVLNPGANRPDKRWPAERFAAVADVLARSHGLAAVASGSSTEMNVLDAVVRAAKSPIMNLAKRGITLGTLKAVIEQAKLLITNDTGPRHLAVALGTPVVTLFGPTDHRWTTPGALNCPRERLMLAEPFLPEQLVADRHSKACAIDRIPVSDVISAARALLNGNP